MTAELAPGEILRNARSARGLTIEAAARACGVRARFLVALEAEDPVVLGGLTYVRGHLRTYAHFLGLEPEVLLAAPAFSGPAGADRDLRDRLRHLPPFAGALKVPTLTPRLVGGVLVVAMVLAFAGYLYVEIESARLPSPATPVVAATLPVPASASRLSGGTALLPVPSPSPRPLLLRITATDTVWIDVSVDGRAQFSDSGRVLAAGDSVQFTGLHIRVSSGKGGATMIRVDGRDLGPVGAGVVTREFSAQT